jgi:protein phosphatase
VWVHPANAQAQGARREQQDSFAFSDHGDHLFLERAGFLAILADGMGGMALGREASDVAVQALLESYAVKEEGETVPRALERSFLRANRAVCEMGRQRGFEDSVGTTAVAAVVWQDKLFWANVGDSRLYLWRKGNLRRISRDHNLRERLRGQGLSEDVIASSRHAEALTSYLGGPEIPILDVPSTPWLLEAGDRVLLCSDGLYRGLGDEEMARVLAGAAEQSARALLDEVLSRHHPFQDNVTVLVLAVEEEKVGHGDVLLPRGKLPGSLNPGEFFRSLTWPWKKK